MNKNNKDNKNFNLKNSEKIRDYFKDAKDLAPDAPVDENTQIVEIDEDGIEYFIIEDFNEPKKQVIEEENPEDFEYLEDFNEFKPEEVEEDNPDDYEEYEGSQHTLSKLTSSDDGIEYDDDYEVGDNRIAKLGQNVEIEEAESDDETKEDNFEYEEYIREEEQKDNIEYEYIEDDDDEEQNTM